MSIRHSLLPLLGSEFWSYVTDDGWLAAYAAVTTYELTPSGPEKSPLDPITHQIIDLKEFLAFDTMACDIFCHVAIQLFELARPDSPAIIHRIGWAGEKDKTGPGLFKSPPDPSPVDNHAQLIVCSGMSKQINPWTPPGSGEHGQMTALFLDPTIGAVGVVPFPGFFDGEPCIFYRRIGQPSAREIDPNNPKWKDGFEPAFPDWVQSALEGKSGMPGRAPFNRNQLLYIERYHKHDAEHPNGSYLRLDKQSVGSCDVTGILGGGPW